MTPSEFAQLKKLLTLTISDNDAEALGAMRAANRVLMRGGFTWAMLLDRQVPIINEVEAAWRDPIELKMENAIVTCAMGDVAKVSSIYEQWKREGYVTELQRKFIEGVVR